MCVLQAFNDMEAKIEINDHLSFYYDQFTKTIFPRIFQKWLELDSQVSLVSKHATFAVAANVRNTKYFPIFFLRFFQLLNAVL